MKKLTGEQKKESAEAYETEIHNAIESVVELLHDKASDVGVEMGIDMSTSNMEDWEWIYDLMETAIAKRFLYKTELDTSIEEFNFGE